MTSSPISRRVTIIALAIGCGVAAAVLIGTVLLRGSQRTASITGGHQLRARDVRFSGGTLLSPLYLSAGPDQFSLNVYRAQTSLSDARPITAYRQGRGVTGFAVGHSGKLVVAAQGADGNEHILVSSARGLRPLPGGGDAPALAPDGRLAYAAPFYRGYDGDVEVIVDHGHTRAVFRVHDPERIFESLWSSRGELALVVGSSGHARIVLDPGAANQREIPYPQHEPGFPGTNDVAFMPSGELTYLLGDSLVVRAPNGAVRKFSLRGWDIECWTASRKLIVTAGAEDPLTTRIGAFDPDTGKVTMIGSVQLGVLFQIACPES